MNATNQNLDCNETINQFGVESTSFGVGMNVKELTELTHSQQQPQAPKTHRKGVNSQGGYQNHNALGPPFRLKDSKRLRLLIL